MTIKPWAKPGQRIDRRTAMQVKKHLPGPPIRLVILNERG
jgi:hypothetical protein